ncbi:hypothetical protein B6U80_01655 [Candidatus Pacearchaeota archaeon ex4484_26]|nr:MAG: hypothetical protein B6U80_01655 [Candidatus Pacearchaeota archaeon ex4484_26]
MKNKRGATELPQEELVKLIIVALIAALILYFIYSSATGEVSKLISRSKEYALWLDAAFNSDDFTKVNLSFPKEANLEVVIHEGGLEVKDRNKVVGQIYRLFENQDKGASLKETDTAWEMHVR